jgi:hypothetical protein
MTFRQAPQQQRAEAEHSKWLLRTGKKQKAKVELFIQKQ